ncbi:GLUG motif-containing protein [Eubacteriaceae bacterium ES2]|nr:GLUG motif-containing protein [Eubacteriaceae bacterium ES2]
MKFKKLILFTGLLLVLFFLSGTSVLAEGTVSDTPFQIGSATDFNLFAQAVNESSTNTFTIGTGEAAVTYTDAQLTQNINFESILLTPIGAYVSYDPNQNHPFTGTFDGNDKTITVNAIDSSALGYGIFGYLKGATVKDLQIDANLNFSATSGVGYFGGIAGLVEGNSTIENCSVCGTVTNNDGSRIGGIAGNINASTIKNCSVSAQIGTNSISSYIGGVAGYAKDGTITNCCVSGTVIGTNFVGGIAGYAKDGAISNCCFTASISGTHFVGGLVGDVEGGTIDNLYYPNTITNGIATGYYSGNITPVSTAQFESGEISWKLQNPDKQSPAGTAQSGLVWGQTLSGASGSVPELTTETGKQVYQLTINRIDGSSNIYYKNTNIIGIGSATEGCLWVDGNYQEITGTSFTLSSDMTINEAIQTPTFTTDTKTSINQNQTAGLYFKAPDTFSGTIAYCRYQIDGADWSDAADYTDATTAIPINNLTTGSHTISVQVKTDNSPWSQTASVEIYVLAVSDSTIQIASPADFNAFATYINNGWDGGTIDDAVLTADLSLDSSAPLIPIGLSDTYPYSGSFNGAGKTITCSLNASLANVGVFGYTAAGASIQNLNVTGTIIGSQYIGGIVGTNEGTIENCSVSASLDDSNHGSSSAYCGGIAGKNSGSITNCTYSGSLLLNSSANSDSGYGGIAGSNYGTIVNCSVSGSVSTKSAVKGKGGVGGIAGIVYNGNINCCSVSANVSAPDTSYNIGGIVGLAESSFVDSIISIDNCLVSGAVSGTANVGGINGKALCIYPFQPIGISNCLVSGSVSGSSDVGGILGCNLDSSSATVDNVFYPASVSKGIGNGTDDTNEEMGLGINQTSDFTTGSVAWILRTVQENNYSIESTTPVWGQLLTDTDTESKDATPVLNAEDEGTAYDIRQIHRLLFYNSADAAAGTITYTRYANNSGQTVTYPTPATGYYWKDKAGNLFDDTTLVSSDMSLVETQLQTMNISVSAAITTTTGSTPSFDDYGFTGTFPTDYVITYSTDNSTFSATLPTFSTAGTYTVYFNITAPAYADKTDLTTTVTVNNPVSPGGGGGGGGSVTPTMTGIQVPEITVAPDGALNFDITGLPAGAIVYYSTDGITYTTTPPSFSSEGDHTVYIKITASGYQDFTTTTTVTVAAGDDNNDDNGDGSDGGPIILTPLTGNTGTQPETLSGGGFGFAYSYDLAAYLSGSATTSAASNTDSADNSLSVASATGYSIASIDDPYDLLADGDNAPAISDSGVFSCYLNYAAGSPGGQTTAETSGDTETAAASSTETSDNPDSLDASDDTTVDTNDDTADSDTVMLSATVVINVTLESGDITPVTLDIEVPQQIYTVDYRTHIQNIGWEDEFVENGTTSGTEGQSLRLEAIEIQMASDYDLGVSYRTHVQNLGWEENYVSDGQESGTDGQGLRLEAIELALTGTDADYFDIYYQVHVQNLGWLDWASNGHPAGSAGFGYRLEGIRIVVVPKGADAPGATANCFVEQ